MLNINAKPKRKEIMIVLLLLNCLIIVCHGWSSSSPFQNHLQAQPLTKRGKTQILTTGTTSFTTQHLQAVSTTTATATNVHAATSIDIPAPKVSEEDKHTIMEQLGYIPTNLHSVSARRGTGTEGETKFGTPLALKAYSLNGGASRRKAKALGDMTPFPTLYWFCCPVVAKALGELEWEGYVGILEKRLMDGHANHNGGNGDTGGDSCLDLFIKSHEGYARERWMGLTKEHREYLERKENKRMMDIIRYSGIAGMDFRPFAPNRENDDPGRVPVKASIKCLHAHYAHYRSQVENEDGCDYPINVVGKWIHEILQERHNDLIL
jgi:hypothetical protein